MSWQPLCADDPFPGDPGALRGAAATIAGMAAGLREQITQLNQHIGNASHWQGSAHDAFADKAGDLPVQIGMAAVRYSAGANALGPYITALDEAQATAGRLRIEALDAQSDVSRYTSGVEVIREHDRQERVRAERAVTDPSYGSTQAQPWAGPNYARLLAVSEGHLADLRGRLSSAIAVFDGAAASAAAGLLAAADVAADDNSISGKIDHLRQDMQQTWRDFKSWVKEHADDLAAISEVLGNISAVLGLLALLPIPGFSQAMTALSLATAGASLLIDVALCLAGEKNPTDLIWSATSLAISVGAPMVAGKVLRTTAAARAGARTPALATTVENTKRAKKLIDAADDVVLQNKANVIADKLGLNYFRGPKIAGLTQAGEATMLYTDDAIARARNIHRLAYESNVAGRVTKFVSDANDLWSTADSLSKVDKMLTPRGVAVPAPSLAGAHP